MNKNAVTFSLMGVALLAALSLAASPGNAEEPMHDGAHMEHMEHQHDHAGHAKESAKTPQQKKAIGFIKKGDALCEAGKHEDALPIYTKAIAADPAFAEVYYKRGKAFYRIGGDLSALEDFSKAIELNPNYTDAYFQRGIVWFHIGEEGKMIEDFKAAARLGGVDHTSHVHVLK